MTAPMVAIDHPLLEAERAIESGFLDPDALERVRVEWAAGPRTPAMMRESVFEILGWRGCVPLAFMEVVDPATLALEFPGSADAWLAVGVVDDASVLALADGSWLGVAGLPEDADRPVGGLFVTAVDAVALSAQLAEGRKPVWAVPATYLMHLGTEREFREFMDAPASA